MALRIALAVVLGSVLLARSVPDADANVVFSYAASKPLHYQEAEIETSGDAKILEIYYDSPKVGRVPAYLVVTFESDRQEISRYRLHALGPGQQAS